MSMRSSVLNVCTKMNHFRSRRRLNIGRTMIQTSPARVADLRVPLVNERTRGTLAPARRERLYLRPPLRLTTHLARDKRALIQVGACPAFPTVPFDVVCCVWSVPLGMAGAADGTVAVRDRLGGRSARVIRLVQGHDQLRLQVVVRLRWSCG